MRLTDIVVQARRLLKDVVLPSDTNPQTFWSNDELTDYVNESISEMCRKAWMITDTTTAGVCMISVVAGTISYQLNSAIHTVNRAYMSGVDSNNVVTAYGVLQKATQRDIDSYMATTDTATGHPKLWHIEGRNLVISPIPDSVKTYTIKLQVLRTPLVAMTWSNYNIEPEIDNIFHFGLADGVAYYALRNLDTETADQSAMMNSLARWNGRIEEAKRTMLKRNTTFKANR